MIAVAGFVAESKWVGEPEHWRSCPGCQGDWVDALSWAELIHGVGSTQAVDYVNRKVTEVRSLVEAEWENINAVAEAVFREGTRGLTGVAIDAILGH